MKRILLCSSNPLLIRTLGATLRDEGHEVQEAEHPALAVRRVLRERCDIVVLDAAPFGLPAEDAACLLREAAPEVTVLCLGAGAGFEHLQLITVPPEIDAIKELIHHVAA